jgi:uncharacterized protein involved in outer membrane biogenesis
MFMRVIRGLFIALAMVLLLVAVVAAGLLSPPGQRVLHDAFTSWASAELGRAVRVDGDFGLQLGRHIQLRASGVNIANTDWGSRPEMLIAEHVMIQFDAGSLLSRAPTLIIDEVRIDGLDLMLERTADDAENWQFDRPPTEPGRAWLDHLPFVVDRVAMPGAHIQFKGPRLDRPLDIQLNQFGQQRGASDMVEFSASGQTNDVELALTGQIGPFANLIAAKNFSASLDGHIGEVTFAIRTRVDDLARPIDSEVDVEVNGPSAAYVATTLGVRNLGDGPFNLRLSVSRAPDGNGVIGSAVGRVGEFDISANGELSEPSVMARLTLRTEISGPDVSLLAASFGYDLFPPERFHLAATLHRTGQLLQIDQATLDLPDSALRVQGSVKRIDQFAGDDLTIHIAGQKVEKFRKLLRVPGMATGPFEVDFTMHPAESGVDTLQLKAMTTLVNLTASGPLGTYPKFYGTRLRVTVSGADFAPWAQAVGLRNGPRGAFDGQGQVQWTDSGVSLSGTVLNAGGDTLSLDGNIGTPSDLNGDVRFGLQGKSLATVANFVGWRDFPAQPYKIAGRMLRQNGRTRLDGVDITSAGARLQLGGAIGDPPRWEGTNLTFTLAGQELRPFSALVRGIRLPTGPFRAQGAFTYGNDRIGLQNVGVAIAGSAGSVTADIGLPLGTSVRRTQFDIQASGPDLRLLIPDVPDVKAVRQQFDLRAKGSWGIDKWVFETLRFDSPGGYLNVQGQLDRAPDYSATAMNIQARTADLGQTGHLFGIDLPAEPLDFSAAVSGTPSAFRMEHLTGHVGQSDFTGSIALDLMTKPDVDVRLNANFLDLTPLTDSVPDGTVMAPIVQDARSIPNIELPTALFNRINGRIAVHAAKTSFFRQTYDGLQLQASLQDGRLTVDPLTFGSVDGNLTARLTIGTAAGTPSDIRLAATGDQVRLGVWPGMNETAAASRYKLQIDLAASGNNLRDLAATLDGQIRLVGSGGHIPNSRANQLTSDFLGELARTLNPIAKRKPFTDVICQAYLFEAGGGMLRTDPAIVIRTTDVDIISNGSVDLRNEAVDFNFKTAARGGLGFSAGELLNSYVKVSGTLAKPYLTVDPKGTLVYGGAAFATGGLSILATTVWDRLTRQKDPCAAAVAEADRRATNRPF